MQLGLKFADLYRLEVSTPGNMGSPPSPRVTDSRWGLYLVSVFDSSEVPVQEQTKEDHRISSACINLCFQWSCSSCNETTRRIKTKRLLIALDSFTERVWPAALRIVQDMYNMLGHIVCGGKSVVLKKNIDEDPAFQTFLIVDNEFILQEQF